ncbi:amino-acid N-acetyltransferase [uncultured Actinomyces sp.]|uniref:amino-acid N-acetyltransferase n=1 Tax=uncultured Actinomyces sp. TaxID=249061 RepID=UPI0025F44831|nr:amino-acid N-acetyltransferase [uncultured Actinomyces sp.]
MNSTALRTDEHLPTGRATRRAEVYGGDGSRRVLRPARPADVRAIAELVRPYAERRVLIAKDLISYFEDIQEFIVAEEVPDVLGHDGRDGGGGGGEPLAAPRIVGCGALHVMWDDIAEVRTLAVHPEALGTRLGSAILRELITQAREMGLKRVFCLTFEEPFFGAHGFEPIEGTPVGADVFSEMLRSHDDGLAEFLDLARVKPNTLGNARMLLQL